jgi:hypothetical protein
MITMNGMNNNKTRRTSESGIALLITLLIMTVLLGVSASLLNITIKQFQFSSIGLASEKSFQAANAGMECMLYHDYENYPTIPGKFDIGQNPAAINCMGVNDDDTVTATTDSVQRTYIFSWGAASDPVCTETTIYKFNSTTAQPNMAAALRRQNGAPGTLCPIGSTCTVVQSRGYNVSCAQRNTPRVIERELTQKY